MEFDQVFFNLGSRSISLQQSLRCLLIALICFVLFQIVARYILPMLFDREQVEPVQRRRIRRWFGILALLAASIFILRTLDLDLPLISDGALSVRISSILFALFVLVLARFLDWYIAKVLLHRYYLRRAETSSIRRIDSNEDSETRASRTVQYILYTIAAIVLLGAFDLNYTLLNIHGESGAFVLRISSILSVILILLIARLVAWIFTQVVLYSYYQQQNIDPGRRFAINRLITYFIFVIAIFLAIDNLGVEMTVLWGGIAALLVGIGLGLQEIFKDLISGILLLFERTVEVGDVIELDEGPGYIRKIGLRTSLMQVRNDAIAIVPNSALVSNKVINWSHTNRVARFSVKVGVSYSNDPTRVREIMLAAIREHQHVEKYPIPFVRFQEFAESSLLFEVFFWSRSFMQIDDVKSDIRFAIFAAFAEADIEVPFPQLDVRIRDRKLD